VLVGRQGLPKVSDISQRPAASLSQPAAFVQQVKTLSDTSWFTTMAGVKLPMAMIRG
jgi:hypothetical protein